MAPPEPVRLDLPAPVRALVERLREAGFEAVLVGGCVRNRLTGRPAPDHDVATSARPEQVLALFPRAVPIGLRHGTVMVPTRSGPVDVTTYRGPDLASDLARRDFTVNAMAWDPLGERLIDPLGGREDLAAGRLRAAGRARERLAEDPLRALRAARFVADPGLEPDAELRAALPEVRSRLAGLARERIRRELEALLPGEAAGRGIRLLRESGLESALVPDAPADAADVIDALPRDLELRLMAWLRGTPADAVLERLRFPRARSRRIAQRLRQHPIRAGSDGALRRLARRVGEDGIAALLALRGAELRVRGAAPEAAPERAELDALTDRLERLRAAGSLALGRARLALGGQEVMQALGCGPGPEVGAALRHLTECVLDDPSCNRPDRLRAALAQWARRHREQPGDDAAKTA